MTPSTRVLLLGSTGLLGSALARRMAADGFTDVHAPTRAEVDLLDRAAVADLFTRVEPEVVLMAAGVVGGIVRNRDFPADLIEDNLVLQTNVLASARRSTMRRLVFLGSSCMYPRECPQPMAEASLGTGAMEPTSLPYSTAKHAGMQLCLAYNRQDGRRRFLPLIPNTIFGPGDDFDLEGGHFLPALIRRFHEAREGGKPSVTLWGTGTPRRELVYSDDVADAILHVAALPDDAVDLPVNIGTGEDRSISEVAALIQHVVGYRGQIQWDTSKPDGAPRKFLDSFRLRETGWSPKVGFEEGIRKTYAWYLENLAPRTS